jgi:hypothetical protein
MTEQGKVSINRQKFPKIVDQMRRYKMLIQKDRFIGYGCKEGHDDCVSCLASAVWGLKQGFAGNRDGLPLSYA